MKKAGFIKIAAGMCAVLLSLQPIPILAAENSEQCFFWNKDKENEETVLDENITPRRGNGADEYYNSNPAKETADKEIAQPKCKKNDCENENKETDCKEKTDAETTALLEESYVSCGNVSSAKAYNWYCPHRTDGKAPEIPPEMSFIEKHGGYYLDHAASDDDKVIYLTFDVGYENGNVEKILDTLKAENVPGAFFILDNLITANTDLVKRMAEEGHTVCNHTAKHRNMSKVTDKSEFEAELLKLEQVYKECTGNEMAKYYRPPEGCFSELNMSHANELGYKTIFWSFAYADWDNEHQMPREKAIEKVLTGTHNGEILLLHPTSATNADILPDLIHEWKKMGYRFGTLDELVSMP